MGCRPRSRSDRLERRGTREVSSEGRRAGSRSDYVPALSPVLGQRARRSGRDARRLAAANKAIELSKRLGLGDEVLFARQVRGVALCELEGEAGLNVDCLGVLPTTGRAIEV